VKALIMKLTKSRIAILAIVAIVVSSPAAYAQMVSSGARYAGRNCTWCHGNSLQGFAVAPRLAGQNREYIVKQLDNIRNNTRNNPYTLKYMSHAAEKVTPEMAYELADYFSSLPPEAASNGDEGLVARGRAIFEGGIPASNVVACAFCHGPDAQGVRVIPRLGGQSYHYLKRRLEQWGEGYYVSADHMPGVAAELSPDQIEALASYLSFVKSK
jgi:cytochrome c553